MSTNTENTLTVSLGALAAPLTKQLEGYASQEQLQTLDKLANAITLLVVQGIISDGEARNARKRLMKRVCEDCELPTTKRRPTL